MVERRATPIDREQEFSELVARVPALSPELRAELEDVPTSGDQYQTYRPCSVRLRDGTELDAVYLAEARSYLSAWGVVPWKDRGKQSISAEEIVSIADSPVRLPPEVANRIYEAGESGMGYCIFELVLADGRTLSCITGNAADFVDLPESVSPSDIVDVHTHRGAGRSTHRDCEGMPYRWAIYRDESTQPDRPFP